MDMEGLSMICAGLGIAEEDENGNRAGYAKSEYCLENLKDLLRFLRRDDPQTREVFKQVCKWNTVSKDLIPIIEHCQDDHNLVLNAVKVLVFLTMPIEAASNDISQQMEYLWGLKSSITSSDTVAVVVSLLESPLENLEREAFTEDDWKLVQLVLTLFRNILAVQGISLHQKAGGSANQFLSLRDRFLELLFHENVMDLIIVLTQHVGGSCGYLRQDSLLLLETFHYIFMGQEPELTAKAHLKGSKEDADAEVSLNSLRSIMEEEEEKRRLIRQRNLSRHSQFSGTFTRFTMDGSKTLFNGNPTSFSHDTLHKLHKVHRGPLKRTVWDHGRVPSTKDKILQLLHDFVNQFLSGGYNVLMQSIREDIEKEHHAIQNCDVVVFFQVAQFVSSFQHHKFLISETNMETDTSEAFVDNHADSTLFKGNICGPIAESMNESMFLLVLSRWRYAFDGLKETNDHKFLSAAGSLMKIMIRMLDLVLKLSPKDSKEPQTARILLYKLFYDQTDQGMTHFLLNLIKSFDIRKQPKSDLADLVEMINVVVRLIENLQAYGTLRVSRKSRKGRKKKILSDKDSVDKLNGEHATVQNEIYVSSCEQSVDLGVSQKENSINASCDGKEDVSVSIQDDEPEPEPEPFASEMKKLGGKLPQIDSKNSDRINDNLCYGTDDSSGDEQLPVTNEVDFKVSTLVSAFANDTIIHNLCWLLNFYKSNSTSTNHYIICMLRRICDDLELSPMLYQLSLLTTFYNILVEQKSCPCKEYENIVYFLTILVRRMLRKMKRQPLLFVEILFWKTRRECHYINSESLSHELYKLKKETGNWMSGSGDREIGPLQGEVGIRRSIADALGDDEADFVISCELDDQRNNGSAGKVTENTTSDLDREIDGKENSDNGGHSMIHETENSSKRKKRLVLNGEQEEKIKDLYEKYKDNRHCSRLIAEALDPDGRVSPVQVSNKLKHLGYKVPSKKRTLHADETSCGDPDQLREGRRALENEITLKSNGLEKISPLRQALHTRKRVCAFGKDQEMMIEALFEQFKDHKRCCYMIANALDSDGTFTAAQVSRKLKQLGLHVRRQKGSEATMHLIDEEFNDNSTDVAQNSDDETLLSLRQRNKDKRNNRFSSEEVLKKRIDGKLSEDDSDDQLLSSVLEKDRRCLPVTKSEKLATASFQQSENDSGIGVTRDVIERGGLGQPSKMDSEQVDMDAVLSQASLDGNSEAEATGICIEKQLSIAPVSIINHLTHQLVYDELAEELEDSGDDGASVASPKNAVIRRKLRMVIDDVEDD